MRDGKHGLKALVLGIMVALGAMAFTTAGAQAQTHSELFKEHLHQLAIEKEELPLSSAPGLFLVNLGAALLATITAELEGTRVLLIAGRSLEVRCTGLELIGAKIDSSRTP